jgi:enoyl-CoA hydratase/carnithine racemase
MPEPLVLYEKTEGIATITLNRPEKMNAVTDEMQATLTDMAAEATLDDAVRVVILTGVGRAFCGGTDVTVLGRSAEERDRVRLPKNPRPLPETTLPGWRWTKIPKPVIAAINGPAVGMGAEWVVQCDFRLASDNARIGWVFSQRGLVPDTGAGPYLLPLIVGMSKALELMYSGRIIDAQEALKIGLVSAVYPPDKLMPAARELALTFIKSAPLSVEGIKELTYGALAWPPEVHRLETGKRFRASTQSEDGREGIRAFREKRPPQWKGR